MSGHTELSTPQRVLAWQAKSRALPRIYAVWVRCDGEESLDGLYDSKEAAELHRDWYNNLPGNKGRYYGTARVVSTCVLTLELAQERFANRSDDPAVQS